MDGEALREPFDHCLAPGFLELEPRSRRCSADCADYTDSMSCP
jgi:hypothetical protein